MELGESLFFIPEMVAKGRGAFLSLADACGSLIQRIERDIELQRETTKRLYAELEKTKQRMVDAEPQSQGLLGDGESATLSEKPGSASESVGGEENAEESDRGQTLDLHP